MSETGVLQKKRGRSPNVVLAIIIGVIVVAVALIGLLSSNRTVVTVDRATPVGTVQAYLKAILDGKNSEAAKLISTDSRCTVDDIDRAYVVLTTRVDLVDSTISGNTAEVKIRIEIPSGGPFGDFMTEDHTIRLIRSGGSWLVTGIPWPLYDCGVLSK